LLSDFTDANTSSEHTTATFTMHVNGVLQIMRLLATKTMPLITFWPLIRDEILWTADHLGMKTLIDSSAHDFRQLLGPKSIDQRKKYE
jgi:hypothetical protein